MKVVITGGSGFVGRHLIEYYLQKKASVICVTRQKRKSDNALLRYSTWEELEQSVKPIEGADAIINLAGESINQRWTKEAKARILNSRLDTVARVRSMIERLEYKPVLVNASGISIYGLSETETFSEESELYTGDFLSSVVDHWEGAAEQIPDTRVVLLRVGIVLGSDGGAFPKMSMPFKFGFGGRIGSGRQILSWIHIDDMVRLIDFCVEKDDLEGPVNATAPQAVTSDEFGRTLAKVMGKPYAFPVPAFVMKLAFGELAALLLEGQRVLPKVALEQGFQFRFPTLSIALEDLNKSRSVAVQKR